ncbi:MAG: type II secretion system F family protein, partial [Magnetococcus sp. YQC-9]
MAYFHYKLIAREGMVRGGVIHLPFDSPLSAIAYLERQGGTVIFAHPLHPWLGATWGVLERFFETKVEVATMAEALNNVAIMLKAGIPVVAAVQDSLAEHDNPTLAKVGRDLVNRIHSGSSLSDAARKWQRYFPDTALFLMRIGEETGSLDKTIQDASRHMIKVDKIVRETKGALMYPAIMFTVIFMAMAFWLYAVVP